MGVLVKIVFRTRALQRLCNDRKIAQKELGEAIAKRLMQRLADFDAADSLADISHLPPARCHELSGEKSGLLAVDLPHPFRVEFRPADEPLPLLDDGSLDRSKVIKIEIHWIGDYHGKKRR